MRTPTPYIAGNSTDEIDLIDLWLTLKQHRKLFAVVVAVVMLLTTATALLLSPQYDYFATLQIGGFRNDGRLQLVEQPAALQAKLQEGIIPQIIANASDSDAAQRYDLSATSPEGSDVIVLSAKGSANEAAAIQGLLQRIVTQIESEHAAILTARQNEARELLQDNIATLQVQLDAMRTNRERLVNTPDKSDALAVVLLDNRIQAAQARLDRLEHELRVELLSNMRNTAVVTPPTRSMEPATPGPTMIFVLGGVFAFMFASMAVLVAAFAKAAVAREAEQNLLVAGHESASGSAQSQRPERAQISKHSVR